MLGDAERCTLRCVRARLPGGSQRHTQRRTPTTGPHPLPWQQTGVSLQASSPSSMMNAGAKKGKGTRRVGRRVSSMPPSRRYLWARPDAVHFSSCFFCLRTRAPAFASARLGDRIMPARARRRSVRGNGVEKREWWCAQSAFATLRARLTLGERDDGGRCPREMLLLSGDARFLMSGEGKKKKKHWARCVGAL